MVGDGRVTLRVSRGADRRRSASWSAATWSRASASRARTARGPGAGSLRRRVRPLRGARAPAPAAL